MDKTKNDTQNAQEQTVTPYAKLMEGVDTTNRKRGPMPEKLEDVVETKEPGSSAQGTKQLYTK